MKGAGAALALALAASPALAQVTADDVWRSWGTALGQLGVEQTGSIERDGARITVSGAGAAFDLPFGRIGWNISRLALHEESDGTVRLTIPRAVPVTLEIDLDLHWRHPRLRLGGELTAEGLDWRYSGSSDDIRSDLSARRLTFEMTGLEGAVGDHGLTTGFVVAEDVVREASIRSGAAPRIEAQVRIGHLVRDISTTSHGTTTVQRAEYRGLAGNVTLRLPETPLAAPSLSDALRAGMRLHARAGAGQMLLRDIERRGGETRRDMAQSLRDGEWSLDLARGRGLELGLSNTGSELLLDNAPVARAEAARLGLRLPLIARRSMQDAGLVLSLEGVEALGAWADLTGGATAPGHLDLAVRSELLLNTDFAEGGPGTAPYDLLRLELQTLDASWGEAALTGSGAFDWLGGSGSGRNMARPEGEAVLVAEGLYATLTRLAAAGRLSGLAAMSLRGALAAFGNPVGPDKIEARVALGDEGLIVNGMPLPF